MPRKKDRILIVDDEEICRELLEHALEKEGFDTVSVEDGKNATEILEKDSNFDAILLDRMMPGMTGLEVFAHLKSKEATKDIPVIMQTAASEETEIQQGIDAGVYYYLTKPFEPINMVALVENAINDKRNHDIVLKNLNKNSIDTEEIEQRDYFTFKTLNEVERLVPMLSKRCPNNKDVALGLSEIMVNAIEHGNLEIDYQEKKALLLNRRWLKEIEKRCKSSKYKKRFAKISIERHKSKISFYIEDQGRGFNWEQYMTLDPKRLLDPNGRGILCASATGFDSICYEKPGNKVRCTIKLDEENSDQT